MQLHQLQRRSSRPGKKLVGRGGKRGTTAGRGTKGQKARAGHRIRPAWRETVKRLPKKRGQSTNFLFRSSSPVFRPLVITLAMLEKNFAASETISPASLLAKHLLKNSHQPFKILGGRKSSGEQRQSHGHKLIIKNCSLSKSVKAAVLAAGGSVI